MAIQAFRMGKWLEIPIYGLPVGLDGTIAHSQMGVLSDVLSANESQETCSKLAHRTYGKLMQQIDCIHINLGF
jgi:hypothetical protein